MRDVNYGWLIRYLHANVASFFFIFVYALNFLIIIKLVYYFLNFLFFKLISISLTLLDTFYLKIERMVWPAQEVIDNFFNLIKPLPNLIDKTSDKNKANFQDNEFLQWFVGFTDAEGCFKINIKNKTEVHFVFQIVLHVADVAVLYTIREKLGIGVVSIKGSICSYRVHSFQVIVNTLIPIFDKYPLLTQKQLDYRDWKKAILLKKEGQVALREIRSLSLVTLENINEIKNGMNTSRINYEGYHLSNDMITNNWLVGFVEGDGTFHFSNNSAIFGITQKDKKILEAISDFLKNIPLSPPYNNLVVPNKPNCIISKYTNKNAYKLVITDKDVLFQYIYPYFKNLKFYSRKRIDFIIWIIGLFVFIYGYAQLPKGKELLLKLSNNMNSKRYISDLSDLLDVKEIEELFSINPPFDIHSAKSNFLLSKEYSQFKGSRKGFRVYIYKNSVEIKGSPFSSYREGGKAIGLNSVSSITNYIDTGKVFKDGYTFYSSPVEFDNE
jgi:hypothetical protein